MNISATDRTMMARCAQLASQAAAEGEYPFGSLIARGETVIAEGINHSVRESDESRHAEIVAIALARRTLGRKTLRDCTLYSTVEPCAMCSFCIRAAGVGRVVFALHSPVLGGMSRWDILQTETLSRRLPFLFRPAPEILTGVEVEAVQKVWRDWRPLVWWAIKRLGFFAKR
ncbi:MAG: nucleoside deaminase [Roseiarcus sp.]|jgi:tRNA(adenine34) deaminase